MANQDQNQNTIPGTLRTLKTDLSADKIAPQDRLQQAGNFVQARPDLNSPVTPPKPVSQENTLISQSTSTPKKDVPVNTSPKSEAESIYSWTNSNLKVGSSSTGFSALDDSIDLPLDNTSTKTQPTTSFNPASTPYVSSGDSGVSALAGISQKDGDNDFKISNINTGSSINEDFNFNSDVKSPSKTSKSNGILVAGIVILLLGLIGGGIYVFNINRPSQTQQSNNTDQNTNTTNEEPNNTTPPQTDNAPKPLFDTTTKIDVSFVDTEPIRKTILSNLNSQKETLVEMNLTKSGSKISILDLSSVLGINIPPGIINNVADYKLYAYNQQGIYKFTATIQLNQGQDAKSLVESWAPSIPRDMSGFSLNVASRIVNNPNIKTSIITSANGTIFDNYYYNYTSPVDSIDVSSSKNYVIMASSQDSMRFLLDQVK